jgi:hypothetical protein
MSENNLPVCPDCELVELSKTDTYDLINFLRDVRENYNYQRSQLWIKFLMDKIN